jgi:hypothetical protein
MSIREWDIPYEELKIGDKVCCYKITKMSDVLALVYLLFITVLRIRDVYPGSGKNLFRIPDPGVKKAPDPGSGSAILIYHIKKRSIEGPIHCL